MANMLNNTNLNHIKRSPVLLIVITLTITSFAIPSLITQILAIFIFSFFAIQYMPSPYILTRLAYALFLPIALSPLYLVIRRFFNFGSVTRFDLFFMLAFFVITITFYNRLKNRDNKSLFGTNGNFKIMLAGLGAFFALAMIQIYLYSKSLGHLFAWFGSGDSRNHLGFGRHVADIGGLNPLTMLQQPIGAPAFLGMILGWKNQLQMTDSAYFISDLATYGFTWVYFIGLIGVVFAATTYSLWQKIYRDSKAPKILLALSSLFALSSLILGTGLIDGFYTAIYGGLTTSLLILWVLESGSTKIKVKSHFLIGFLIFLGTIMAWSYMILISLPLLLIGIYFSKQIKFDKKMGFIVFLLVAIFILAFNFDPIKNLLLMAKSMLLANGRISAPNPKLFTSFGLVVLLAGIVFWNRNRKLSQLLLTISAVEIFSVYVLKAISGIDFSIWNYYTLKFQWIALISIYGISTSIVLVLVYPLISNAFNQFTKIQKISSSIVATLFLFTFVETFYGSQNIWQKAFQGWMQPSAAVMNAVINNISTDKNPTILFRYIDPGNQMLGNFWLSLYVEPVDPLRGELYFADTQNDVNWLCGLTSFYPEVRVVTADPSLEKIVTDTCSSPQIEVSTQPLIN